MKLEFGFALKKGVLTLAAVLVPMLAAGEALALDSIFAGPRALGMAGANVASVNDTNAQYYNPAAFGFMGDQTENGERMAVDNNNLGRKDWGIDLNGAAGIRMHEDFGDYVDTLADIDYELLSQEGIQTQSDLADLVDLLNGLNGLEDPGNAVAASVNVGLGVRAGHFAVGGRGVFQASGRVLEIDQENLGITNAAGGVEDLNSQITGAVTVPTDYQRVLIDDDLRSQLLAAGLTAEAIDRVDFVAAQEGISSTEMTELSESLTALTEQTLGTVPGGDLADNTSTVVLNGFAMVEVPVSYGYAINEHWSVGANLKLMKGRVYGTEVLVFDDDSGDVLSEVTDRHKESTNFGVDLGIMGRYRMFNVGIVGRNLNSPEFDGFDFDSQLANGVTRSVHVEDVEIKPQVAVGVAFIPLETLTLEVDCDLIENETVLENYDTQNLSVGLEWDAFRFLALRGGIYKNLAESDIGAVYTAGLGLNMWLMRLDIAGAISGETARYDNEDYPKEARVAAQLSIDF